MKNALICTATAAESDRLKIMLLELGFAQILESTDYDRAFSLAVDHVPDVAIIDTAAAGTDWLQALKSIRARMNIPVILLGSAFSTEALEKAIAAGAGGFLAKPVRKEKVAVLEGALESRKSVEKAKGVLMRAHGLSEPDAFRRMQKLAMDKRTTLLKIAEAILLTECGAGRGIAAR